VLVFHVCVESWVAQISLGAVGTLVITALEIIFGAPFLFVFNRAVLIVGII